jgi:hypothetical protein
MDRTDAFVALALVLGGIVVPGLVDHALHRAGYPAFGKVAWVLGMAGLVAGAWAVWLRDVDLTGPIE